MLDSSSRAARAVHVLRAGVRTLRSRDFGADLATVQDGLDLRAFDDLAARMRADPDGRWLLAHQPRIGLSTIDVDALRQLPRGTLGREAVEHLARAGLLRDLTLAPSPFPISPDAAYARTRWRETHDLRHVLTGLGVGLRDEIVLQAFQLGQFDNRFAKLQMLVGPLLQPTEPVALLRDYRAAFRMGRAAAPLILVRWELLWAEPVDRLRARLRVGPLPSTEGPCSSAS